MTIYNLPIYINS